MPVTALAPAMLHKQPAIRPATVQLYADIRKEYNRMKNIKKGKVALYSADYIMQEVGRKFYKSPKTIENIVFNRV